MGIDVQQAHKAFFVFVAAGKVMVVVIMGKVLVALNLRAKKGPVSLRRKLGEGKVCMRAGVPLQTHPVIYQRAEQIKNDPQHQEIVQTALQFWVNVFQKRLQQ